ncbi:MAG: MFS transporter [Planctomycetes bacterium]|nr:MFS transporter [Planctomycetota bacterium]
MTEIDRDMLLRPRTLPSLRWWIGGLLFASTVINYIDRQTLSVLAPFLKQDYQWSNVDFACLVISFRAAYAIGQTVSGRFLDRVGTRRGLTITVLWYSLAALLTSLASGLRSFCVFRFLLGAGESANWPGATKAVAEWFPKRERGWAVALFDSGSSIGAVVASFLSVGLYWAFGWRLAFVFTGTLGFLWLIAWRLLYHPPEDHPRIRESERQMILNDKAEAARSSVLAPAVHWTQLLRLPQTWGVIIGKTLTDPIWFFIADWFAIYLVARGIKVEESFLFYWIPFAAADLGNFFGGGASSWLIRRGWPVVKARQAFVIFGGLGMSLLACTIFTANPWALAALFGFSTFAYAAFCTMIIVLPSDLFPSGSVATVSGMSGTGAGLGTILSTLTVGYVSDHYSFAPILIGASLIPLVAMVLMLVLIRTGGDGTPNA